MFSRAIARLRCAAAFGHRSLRRHGRPRPNRAPASTAANSIAPIAAKASCTWGPQRPMSFTVGTMRLNIQLGHGLHDLGGGDQRTLLAVHELRDRRGLQVMTNPPALLLVHPVPQFRAEDVQDAVVEHHRVLGIKIERPVDPIGGVPLLLLALGIELQQRLARLVILPGKASLGVAVELLRGLLDGERIAVGRRHRVPPGQHHRIWG